MAGGPRAVEVKGLKDFRRELKELENGMEKELRVFHKSLGDELADKARSIASGMGGVRAKTAGAIKGYATQLQASVGFAPGGRYPAASVAFWGAKRHTGWYAHINSSVPQHPKWVGNSWEPGVHGQGPYAINDAVADAAHDLADRYGRFVDDLTARAFPD
jgi:hypothetical protein